MGGTSIIWHCASEWVEYLPGICWFFAGGCVVVESGWLGGGVSDTLLGPEGSRE